MLHLFILYIQVSY